MTERMNEVTISLGTALAWFFGIVAVVVVFSIGLGALHPRWGLTGGLMIALSHGITMWRLCERLKRREDNAFELGRDSVRAIR